MARQVFYPGSVPVTDQTEDLADILSRDIPWETYMTARLITDRDLQLIRRYDKRSEELQTSLLDEVRLERPQTSLDLWSVAGLQTSVPLPHVIVTAPCVQNGASYVDAFVSVLRNVTKEETVQYVLALLCHMLQSAAQGWGPPEGRWTRA
jgi:V-type H+-transporting ATPase subunit H